MKDKKDKRFKKIYGQGFEGDLNIFIDLETGVNYLLFVNGYAGGLTPLLDKDGKVVITDPREYED